MRKFQAIALGLSLICGTTTTLTPILADDSFILETQNNNAPLIYINNTDAENRYADLQSAIDNAKTDDIIFVSGNLTERIYVDNDVHIRTLSDCNWSNEKTLITVSSSGKLTLDGNGTLENLNGLSIIDNYGILNIDGCNLISQNNAYVIENFGTLSILYTNISGKERATGDAGIANNSGGEAIITSAWINTTRPIYNIGDMTINDGNYGSSENADQPFINMLSGNLYINGGTFEAKADAPVRNYGTTLNISGGVFWTDSKDLTNLFQDSSNILVPLGINPQTGKPTGYLVTIPVESVEFKADKKVIEVGESTTLRFNIKPETVVDDVAWGSPTSPTSANIKVVRSDDMRSATITGLEAGTFEFTCLFRNEPYKETIIVKNRQSSDDYKPSKPVETVKEVSMYRVYNPNSGEHFYTSHLGERQHLLSLGWKDEGIGWTAPSKGDAVYRVYNPNAGDHHYTMNKAEKNMLVSLGWKDEGIGWYSSTDKKAVPVYRQYNPNAKKAGSHNYTTNKAEGNYLVSLGWHDEGIGWKAIK